MRNSSIYISTLICVTVMATSAFVAHSGPVNPPLGPVSSSGPSLTDVLNAVSLPTGSELTISEPRMKDPGVAAEPATLARLVVTDSLGVILAGDSIVGGIPGSIKVVGVTHSINVPFDQQTGLPMRGREHTAMKMVKQWDASSPGLWGACVGGTTFPEVKLEAFRIDPGLGEVKYFTIRLEDAIIVSMRSITTGVVQGSTAHMEEVVFTYKKIRWTWESDGTTFEDPWVSAPSP